MKCSREDDETYYLTDSQLAFVPYEMNEKIQFSHQDTIQSLIVSEDTNTLQFHWTGFDSYFSENRNIIIESSESGINIRINENRDYTKFNLGYYIHINDTEYNFFIEELNLEFRQLTHDALLDYYPEKEISGIYYTDVYEIRNYADTLYYNAESGLILLRADNISYSFQRN